MRRDYYAEKMNTHRFEQEWENIDFLMSPDGGNLSLEAVCDRLGLGYEGIRKRWNARNKARRDAA